VLVSGIMIAQAERNSWSELLTSLLAGKPRLAGLIRGSEGLLQCEQSCTESAVLVCHRQLSEMFKSAEQRKNEIDGTLSPFSPQAVGFSRGVPRKPAEDDPTASSGNPITKNVSVLRTDHAACQALLFGMRETAPDCSN